MFVPAFVVFGFVFHGHEDFFEALLDIRRVFLEALIDGRSRFCFRFRE